MSDEALTTITDLDSLRAIPASTPVETATGHLLRAGALASRFDGAQSDQLKEVWVSRTFPVSVLGHASGAKMVDALIASDGLAASLLRLGEALACAEASNVEVEAEDLDALLGALTPESLTDQLDRAELDITHLAYAWAVMMANRDYSGDDEDVWDSRYLFHHEKATQQIRQALVSMVLTGDKEAQLTLAVHRNR